MRTAMLRMIPLCLLLPAVTVFAQCSVGVRDLRCEYLKDPLGIDVRQPRLSWKLVASDPNVRGQRQTAYQVLVAGTRELLDSNQADLWDSAMVASDQSVHVVYGGKPLASGMECFWKVIVKDENGTASPPNEPARWTMGLLEKSDWSGKWIGSGDVFNRDTRPAPKDCNIADPWLRKTFELKAKPARATVCVASVGYHELYINGKKMGDGVLAPA